MAQWVTNSSAMQETQETSILGQKESLKEKMRTLSSILA